MAQPLALQLAPVPLLAGTWAVLRAKRAWDGTGKLDPLTVLLVWATYGTHALAILLAGWDQVWVMPGHPLIAFASGGVLALAGTVLMVAALLAMGDLDRTMGRKHDELVTEGPYAWSRNPQNLGWMMFTLGFALAGRSWLGLGLVLAFAVVYHVYVVKVEEPHLRHVFGSRWRAYRKGTKRYLGTGR